MAARLFFAPGGSRLRPSDQKRGIMANTSSAKKATRKIARRAAINKNRRSRVRTYVRQVEEALASGDKAAAQAAFKAAEPELMRAATKGVMHKNTASRKVSRLAHRLKVLSA
jgi:small subunit ribosomal protein S20